MRIGGLEDGVGGGMVECAPFRLLVTASSAPLITAPSPETPHLPLLSTPFFSYSVITLLPSLPLTPYLPSPSPLSSPASPVFSSPLDSLSFPPVSLFSYCLLCWLSLNESITRYGHNCLSNPVLSEIPWHVAQRRGNRGMWAVAVFFCL